MADDRFENLLKAWGKAYWSEATDDGYGRRSRSDSHPIARSMEFAPGKRNRRATKRAQGRDGRSRRIIMAIAVGLKGFHIVPAEFSDPIRCKETRSVHYQPEAPVPPELQRIEKAVRDLEQSGVPRSFLRALSLRVNYCTGGDHREKAETVNEMMRKVNKDFPGISVDTFRDELLYGRIWVHGRVYSPEPLNPA